ncbi:hypothetical protein GCM10027034_42680 [Ramlibacter solisilvae]|uniref:Uncharacterized protein n=1 Tax=Ramlibacter tataouinensis TaxID=94132 RepID=A0A127JTH9_9BURK|nr:hypothetical protein [Ramlibacter tataouinensis]AMO23250.1 hypothetical protein UC35_10535 [Ramlibacter tataouinensis]
MTNENKTDLYIEFPRKEEALKLTGRQMEQRLDTCIAIRDESSKTAWFWHPGRDLSAAIHWWVREAGPRLIGDVIRVQDRYAKYLHDEFFSCAFFPVILIDANRISSLVLPYIYCATLVPYFARRTATPEGRDRVRGMPNKKDEAGFIRYFHDDLVAKWLIADIVAARSDPGEFLKDLRVAYQEAARSSFRGYWLKHYLADINRRSTP